MKRYFSLALALTLFIMLFSIMPISASTELNALSANETSSGVRKSNDGYTYGEPYAYIGFKDVDLTGVKSVTISAKNNLTSGYDGEWIQVRLDKPKGELLGYVQIGSHSPESYSEYKGAIKEVNGVHNIYFVSTIVAPNQYNYCTVKSFFLSEEPYVPLKYDPVPDENIVEIHNTSWAFTDDLGRKVADFEEVGPLRKDKVVGIFYWTWHNPSFKDMGAINNTEFAKLHPEAKYDYYNPVWPTATTNYYWNEPLFGYYLGTDYWVARKHAEMLANAGVDALFFDVTNDSKTWKASTDVLFKALRDARAEGINAPKIAYMTPFASDNKLSKNNITRIYMNTYMDGNWSDLWFYWEGKPVIMAYTDMLKPEVGDKEDEKLMNEIKEFFTFRGPQASYVTHQTRENQWGWLEIYPQEGYTKNEDGSFEQVTVGSSANHSYATDKITAMNDAFVMGRSYTSLLGHDRTPGAHKYGYFFTEQLNRALEIDPEFMFITGWNEWRAGRVDMWGGIRNAFPDQYDDDGSRDMEPTKGDMKDSNYALLIDAVRKFKGAEPAPVAGAEKTIDIYNVSSWDEVTPEFINNKGSYERKADGAGNNFYENYTQRNNIIKAKVSRDSENLYFYAETAKDITAPEGSKWMKLYIDADRNHATGWEGYDYVINTPAPGDVSSLNADGTIAVIGKAEFAVNKNTLSLKVSKELIGIGNAVDFEFKWVDNAEGDILNFYVDGNSAPNARFNYIYSEKEQKSLSAEERKALSGVTVVSEGSNRAFVSGGKIYTYDPDIRYGTRRINGVLYVPSYFLYDALNMRTVYESDRNMYKLRGADDLYTTVGTLEIRKNGVLKVMTNPVTTVDGIPYVPVTLFSEVLGLELYESGNMAAFGKNINKAAVDALASEF